MLDGEVALQWRLRLPDSWETVRGSRVVRGSMLAVETRWGAKLSVVPLAHGRVAQLRPN
jgi:hypothetical protein